MVAEQLDLHAHARRTDPATSHLAAAAIPGKRVSATKNRVLTLLQAHGSMIDEWLIARWREEWPNDPTTDQRIRTARSDLVKEGRVEHASTWGETKSGFKSQKWKLTERGLLAL